MYCACQLVTLHVLYSVHTRVVVTSKDPCHFSTVFCVPPPSPPPHPYPLFYSSSQCQDPFTGDGQLCVLDSDGDSYPAQPLSTCSENDTNSYCLVDTCPSVPNEDPNDSTPCTGFEAGTYVHVHVHVHE